MARLYEPWAYGEGPIERCLWNEVAPLAPQPLAAGRHRADIAIIGAGYTGLSAALHLAQAGEAVCVLEAERVGFGASGRSGGFCCLGGGKIGNRALTRRFGLEGRRSYRAAERAAVALVEDLVQRHDMEVERHSDGETLLAHGPRHWRAIIRGLDEIREDYGVNPQVIPASALAQHGLGGAFYGAMTIPIGFALNPRAYVQDLARAARRAGAEICEGAPVTAIAGQTGAFTLRVGASEVSARRVIIATNGYSSEDVPPWLAGRMMPFQSSILATRPLSHAEQDAQGWTSAQMAYDTRHLLHYFRLLPDGRFLFGMRGGASAHPRERARLDARIRANFRRLFPAWARIEIPYLWSGLVCLARDRVPFVGPVPEMPGVFAGLAYHGNGVAMGSYAGRLLADLARDRTPDLPYPEALRHPPRAFPLGRHRRLLMRAAMAACALMDR